MLTGKDFVATNKTLEKELTKIWCDVLQLDEIEPDEDFFELGGDSVQGAVIANRIQTAFSIQLSAAAALRTPTIAGLRRHLEEHFPTEIKVFLAK